MYGETREPMSWDRFLATVIRNFAEKHNITATALSGDWIFLLEKDARRHFVFGLDLGLNNSSSKLIARDKSATFEILNRENIPAVPHHLFLRPNSLGSNPDGNWTALQTYFTQYNNNVVCKPNIGSSGRMVVQAQTLPELELAVQNIFSQERTLAVSPFLDIAAEYRITVLQHKALHVYKKEKTDDTILKFNLSSGAIATEVTDKTLIKKLYTIAQDATRAIDITFANVDIVETPKGFFVLEINSGVMFEHYAKQGQKEKNTVENIYNQALLSIFTPSR